MSASTLADGTNQLRHPDKSQGPEHCALNPAHLNPSPLGEVAARRADGGGCVTDSLLAANAKSHKPSVKRLLASLALFLLAGARDPILVPDVSQHEIEIQHDFNGTSLLLFGAILSPEGTRAGHDYDIVVVVEGPAQPMVLRQKRRVAGVWLNVASATFRSVPSFYAVASSRALSAIVDERTAAIYELGLAALQLSPSDSIDPAAQALFSTGLVDLMTRRGLYSQNEHAVTVTGQVLYQARIFLPSSVQTGNYTAETFAISHGRVVASAISRVAVRKQGLDLAIADYAQHDALLYGVLAVAISVVMGWIAGRFFTRT